jgi:hypothetical protein
VGGTPADGHLEGECYCVAGLGWQRILGFAFLPALRLALSNAYLAYEQHNGAHQS